MTTGNSWIAKPSGLGLVWWGKPLYVTGMPCAMPLFGDACGGNDRSRK